MKKIILASASPRRRELLSQIGLEFTVMPSEVEEDPKSTLPQDVVIELSKEKARDVWMKITEGDMGVMYSDAGDGTAGYGKSEEDSQINSRDDL